MNKPIILVNFLTKYAIIILIVLLLSRISFAQSSQLISDSRQTSQGELKIVKDVYTARISAIMLNEKIVFEPNDYYDAGRIWQVFPKDSPKLFLIELTNGSVICAAKYIIVSLSGKTSAATKEFGNCGDAPTFVYRKQSLTLTFPAGSRRDKYKKGAKQIWRYTNGRLKKIR